MQPRTTETGQHTHVASAGKGQIYSYTVVQEAPAGFEGNAPYVLALVQLDEGPVLTAQITDLDDTPLAIGDRVEMVTRKLTTEGERGVIVYGYKFRRVLNTHAV
jgi:hypothetical protein